jgi:hypothetical protein
MELFLPNSTIEQLKEEELQEVRAAAVQAIEELLDAIAGAMDSMVAVATEDNARIMTAAVFLFRASDLMREVLTADAPALQTLGMRSAFEFVTVARFFILCDDGPDEFRRRYNDSLKKDAALGKFFGYPGVPPADFLAHLVDPVAKRRRDLSTIVQALDVHDGYAPKDDVSAESCYRMLYSFVSNARSHASLSSVKGYARLEDSMLLIKPEPKPIFEEPPIAVIGALMRELATEVFEMLEVPIADLPAQLERPPGSASS